MKIGIEALQITVHSGVGRVIEHFCQALCDAPIATNEYHLFIDSDYSTEKLNLSSNVIIHPIKLDGSKLNRLFWMHFKLNNTIRENKIGVMHFTNYVSSFKCPVPYCLTVHDLIAIKTPQFATLANRIHYNIILPLSIKNAANVIVPSNYVRKDILNYKFTSEPNISVIPLAITRETMVLNQSLPEDIRGSNYILMISNIEPKKNHLRAIEAFQNSLATQKNNMNLVIAGKLGWNYMSFLRHIKKYKNVFYLGEVDTQEKNTLYRNAYGFLFPSFEEGYGLPPLEAASFGVPVVGSNIHSFEKLENVDYIEVDPYQVESISNGLDLLVRYQEKRKQTNNIKIPTWSQYVTEMEKIYLEIDGTE